MSSVKPGMSDIALILLPISFPASCCRNLGHPGSMSFPTSSINTGRWFGEALLQLIKNEAAVLPPLAIRRAHDRHHSGSNTSREHHQILPGIGCQLDKWDAFVQQVAACLSGIVGNVRAVKDVVVSAHRVSLSRFCPQ